ncbi:hypothetical protein ACFY2M_32250 [Streptomyces sp. NPDC001276]|uniref:hypothetical protein n=1 Tax=Streptomyces sp. NPDC001276 TaxID=3364555 RepID=UPI003679FB99
MAESTPAAGTSLRDCGPEAHTQPQDTGEDRELTAEPEPAPVPETTPEPEPQAPAQRTAASYSTRRVLTPRR